MRRHEAGKIFRNNWGDVDNLGVSDSNGGVRTLMAWELPSPEEIDDTSLRFVLALYSRKNELRHEPAGLGAYRLLGEWRERTSWRTQPDCSAAAAATFDVSPGEGWKMFDVTDLVREQSRSPRENFGVALCLPARETTQSTYSEIDFVSREGMTPPLLLVVRP